MRPRWLAACGLGLLTVTPAVGQPLPPARPPAPLSAFDLPAAPCNECDRPTALPPLLAVPPSNTVPPRQPGPSGPVGEYDHGHLYLPERAPEPARRRDPACGPDGRFWISPTLELGWTKQARVPALVRLGAPDGPVVYGDERLRQPFRAGLGLTGGLWLDAEHTRGVDASFYYLAEGGNDTTILPTRATLLLPTADGGTFPLAGGDPGYVGSYQAGLSTRFASADVNYRRNLLCTPSARLDALAGYRYGHVGDTFEAYGKRLGPGGEIVRFRDDAWARNEFHGGQIGLAGEYRLDRWYVSATGKVAFGTVFTDTDLEGKFRVNGTVIPSGFYARSGIAGEVDHTRFGVMPTVGLTLGRQIGDHARVFVGYNLLYLTGLTRGPDVIDPTPPVLASNPHTLIPPTSPRRDASTSDFWAQSMSLGMEWRY